MPSTSGVSLDHPVACKVQLGVINMASLKFYCCKLCVEPAQPRMQQRPVDPAQKLKVKQKQDPL